MDTEKLPERIYLQWHGDADPALYDDEPPPDMGDVTWCAEPIWDWDIEYVRADTLLTEREAHKREVEGLKVWQDRWGSLYERLVLRSHAGVKIDAGEVLDMMDVLREQFPLPPDPPQEVK